MAPRRVALICPYSLSRPGGVQTQTLGLARALARAGLEVTVFAPTDGPPLASGEVRVVSLGRSLPVPANLSVAPLGLLPRAWRVPGGGFDLLHLQEPFVPGACLGTLVRARVPVVGTFHASAPASSLYRVARPLLLPLWEKMAARTAVSRPARELVTIYFPGDVRIVPNAVDVASLSRLRREAALARARMRREGRGTLLFVGRLEPRKGADVALRAFLLLEREFPGLGLAVVGSGPMLRGLRVLAKKAGDRVAFLGRLGGEEYLRVLGKSLALLAPARGRESFGVVLLEAMAAGVPVVASDIPGYREAAGGAALLVPPGDPLALASGLASVIEGEGLEELAEKGKARAEQFDWEVVAPMYLEVYAEAERKADAF